MIIPLFNGAAFIADTVRNVLGQTDPRVEVVIVDDGSSDDGVHVVRGLLGDSRITLIKKPHTGIANTRNAGLAWADSHSHYVLFLDQDDVIAPDLLEGLVCILDRRTDAVGAYAIADFIDHKGRPLSPGGFASAMRNRSALRGRALAKIPPTDDVEWPQLFLSNHLYPPSAVLLRREAVIGVGGLDSSYEVADDWDLMLRLLRGGPIVPWDEVRVGYRRHSANASSNTPRNVRETRAVWANTYFSAQNSRDDRAVLHRYWRAHQRASARRKLADARAQFRSGQFGRAVARAIDAFAHLVIPRPFRRWRTRRAIATPGDPIGVRVEA